MPYLRVTAPGLDVDQRRRVAHALTDATVALFTPPRGPSAEETRSHTTVHLTAYQDDELFVGGAASGASEPDVTVELSDWSMSRRQQRRVAAALTPILVELFGTTDDAVNLRFHSYPPSDFAVVGVLLSDRVPALARLAKRVLG